MKVNKTVPRGWRWAWPRNAAVLLHHGAAQAGPGPCPRHAWCEERREQAFGHVLGNAAAHVGHGELQPALALRSGPRGLRCKSRIQRVDRGSSMACMALRARFSSTCSTMVRSHSTGAGPPGCPAPRARQSCARLQPVDQRQHGVEQACAGRRARLVAAAHEVVHALITRPARSAWSAMRCTPRAGLQQVMRRRRLAACLRWPAGSAGPRHSWRWPPGVGSARGSAARPFRPRWPGGPWPAGAPALARESSSARRCSVTSRNRAHPARCRPGR